MSKRKVAEWVVRLEYLLVRLPALVVMGVFWYSVVGYLILKYPVRITILCVMCVLWEWIDCSLIEWAKKYLEG